MRETYLQQLAAHFCGLRWEDLDEVTRHQAKRCLLDYAGCAVFSAQHRVAPAVETFVKACAPPGSGPVWGDAFTTSLAMAALLNAARTSHIEMDDVSSAGAGVHPGVYVITAALLKGSACGAPSRDVLRAIVFGYDVCQRLGMLNADTARDLGLHGPGMIGGIAAAAAAGLVAGQDAETIAHAMSIAACLMPVCPFISFVEGAGVKDLYGGWGAALGILAVQAAGAGLTGPREVLSGLKSLDKLLKGEKGLDVAPGAHYYIHDVAFKEFSGCFSVHPAINALLTLKKKHDLTPDRVRSMVLRTYPYSYALDRGVSMPLNGSSARLSLTFTAAWALREGSLMPDAFFEEALADPEIGAIMERIRVECKEEYGSDAFAQRGCEVEVLLKDGTILTEEVLQPKWSLPPSDEELTEKFECLCQGLREDERRRMEQTIWSFEEKQTEELTSLLRQVGGKG